VSGQQLRQIPASALLAEQLLLFSYNEKFIHPAAFLTAILINRHDLLLWNNEKLE
jgi:hypothetical protein